MYDIGKDAAFHLDAVKRNGPKIICNWNPAADFLILDGSPIPSKLLSVHVSVIRAWLDCWLDGMGLSNVKLNEFKDTRSGAVGTVGYLDGDEWVAAAGFTGGRMLLPSDKA